MNESMNRWLSSYESRRVSGEAEMSQLLQLRPDLVGLSWSEIRNFPVYGLGDNMTIGKSFSMLKKSWRSYKLYRKDGYPAPDLALRILKIQRSLFLPLSQFDELGDPAWVEEQLNSDDQQHEVYEGPGTGVELSPLDLKLQREEKEAALEDVGLIIDDYGNIEKDDEWL